ncbi:MAG: NUDIX domain-containing protein [Candidatus Aenigmatarchaeota archaeon]
MEFLDIVNDKDDVTGKASKKEIYEKLLMHRIVHVMIFNNKGQLALQLRSKQCSFCPTHWSTSAAGHVSSDESYEQAARRELKEELGITSKLEFQYKDIYKDTRPLKKILVTFKTTYNGQFKPNPKEVEKIQFFSLKNIQKMINNKEKFHPELLFLLRKHFGFKKSLN